MKKGKKFILPKNVNKDYGTWKDYILKDFGYATLTEGLDLLFIVLPPYNLILVLTEIVIIVLAMTIVTVILTIRPVDARKNIKARDYLRTRSRYAKS